MSITLKNINDLTVGTPQANDRLVFGRQGETELFRANVNDIISEFASGVQDLSYNIITLPTLLQDPTPGQILPIVVNNPLGRFTYLRFNVLVNGSLGLDTYLLKKGEGEHFGITYGDLLRVDRAEADLSSSPNTITYSVSDLEEINNPLGDFVQDYKNRVDADGGEVFLSNFAISTNLSDLLSDPFLFDFSDSEVVYFVSIGTDLYQFTGINGFYGLGGLELTFNDLALLTGANTLELDDQFSNTSTNGVENKVITKEFNRTNFKGIEITSNIETAQELEAINYRFVNKKTVGSLIISPNFDAPKDFNTFGYVEEGSINFVAGANIDLVSLNGNIINENEAFHLCRVESNKYVLIRFADSSSIPNLQQVLTQGNSTDLPIKFVDSNGLDFYEVKLNTSLGRLEFVNKNTDKIVLSLSDDNLVGIHNGDFTLTLDLPLLTDDRSYIFRDTSGVVTLDPENDLASVRVNKNQWRHQHVTDSIVLSTGYTVADNDYDILIVPDETVTVKIPLPQDAQNRELRFLVGENAVLIPSEDLHKITLTNSVVYDSDLNNKNIEGQNNKSKRVVIKSMFWSGSWKWTILQNESIPN